jgi:hypothetical protein
MANPFTFAYFQCTCIGSTPFGFHKAGFNLARLLIQCVIQFSKTLSIRLVNIRTRFDLMGSNINQSQYCALCIILSPE